MTASCGSEEAPRLGSAVPDVEAITSGVPLSSSGAVPKSSSSTAAAGGMKILTKKGSTRIDCELVLKKSCAEVNAIVVRDDRVIDMPSL